MTKHTKLWIPNLKAFKAQQKRWKKKSASTSQPLIIFNHGCWNTVCYPNGRFKFA